MLNNTTVAGHASWQKITNYNLRRWYPLGKSTYDKQSMKRIGNIYEQITSLKNLQEADAKAQKGKSNTYGVLMHNLNREGNLLVLQDMLQSKTYRTSTYDIFKIYEPKERIVYRLPYFPDRITHHAIMNVLEPIFVNAFTADTYSCIKTRGIHHLFRKLKADLRDVNGTLYCLKFDIKKFYPTIDHDVMKSLLRRKFKDADLLWLLDEIIDSAPGLPIGNYLSQYLANFFLSYFDHWIKEQKRIKPYKGQRICFWLDAHWSENYEAPEGVKECPLLDEISAIKGHDALVLIDDARLFLGPHPWPGDYREWPSFQDVFVRLRDSFPRHMITVVDDYIIAVPDYMHDTFRIEWWDRFKVRYPEEIDLVKANLRSTVEYFKRFIE